MNLPDIINGTLETLGSLFVLNHCRALVRTRQTRGVSLISCVFFTLWGVWNTFWYPFLHQPFSFVGGVFMLVTNLYWDGLLIYYRRKERHGV